MQEITRSNGQNTWPLKEKRRKNHWIGGFDLSTTKNTIFDLKFYKFPKIQNRWLPFSVRVELPGASPKARRQPSGTKYVNTFGGHLLRFGGHAEICK